MTDRSRLRSDPHFLAKVLCNEFKKHDKYHRGMVSSAVLTAVLQDLGLQMDQQNVDQVLRECTVTHDGFLHYKSLIEATTQLKSTAQLSEIGSAMRPDDTPARGGPDVEHDLSTEIRRVYARWDRGGLTDDGFKRMLVDMGVRLTDDFLRLISQHGRSRSVSFQALVQALSVTDNQQRRSRAAHPGVLDPQKPERWTANVRRDPVTWRDEAAQAAGSDPWHRVRSTYDDAGDQAAWGDRVKSCLCDLVDGIISTVACRGRLQDLEVEFNRDLDRLLLRHEQGANVTFREFCQVVFRGSNVHLEQQRGVLSSLHAEGQRSTSDHPGHPGCDLPYATGSPPPTPPTAPSPGAGPGDIITWHGSADNGAEHHRSRRLGTTGDSGDIISWSYPCSSRQNVRGVRPGPNGASTKTSGDIISWAHDPEPLRRAATQKARVPFGTDDNCDKFGPVRPTAAYANWCK
mmetsp:Transcript_22494/g.49204  ORF Transcript_22494/g.49204 Transcript_22494/m.49204 type:complete len:459 (+) Transcript_22494:45-1421(+)|eukprot:CAMPEP_0204368200 /NCGR_PEP_ID=MMETSP0469-20131031/44009_1 /ASSEMBLY_ACC=CAM_ASM_000384 /TAXON_ID=2969 /ORGANISM="Oxyrrhis marina" /LENGTH=458 /DNA_ID=CAMNT_0051357727 /DNA_START=38 /DNA_END=1414 /DNA_ORIENTATION=+